MGADKVAIKRAVASASGGPGVEATAVLFTHPSFGPTRAESERARAEAALTGVRKSKARMQSLAETANERERQNAGISALRDTKARLKALLDDKESQFRKQPLIAVIDAADPAAVAPRAPGAASPTNGMVLDLQRQLADAQASISDKTMEIDFHITQLDRKMNLLVLMLRDRRVLGDRSCAACTYTVRLVLSYWGGWQADKDVQLTMLKTRLRQVEEQNDLLHLANERKDHHLLQVC
jgi:hypothetical protein